MASRDIPSTILVFTPEIDSGLEGVLHGLCPESQVQAQPFRLEDWFQQCHLPGLSGVLVDTDALSLADLRTIGAGLQANPRPWLLLMIGDRGLAGFENLLEQPRIGMLPKPWTPAGLRQTLQLLQDGPAPTGQFPEAFLGGMVEGLRDPLTSISGYLQLLESQDDERTASLVTPALEAASQIAAQLEYLHLAAAELQPHVAPTDLQNLIEELAESCLDQDILVEVEASPGLQVDADGRYLRAAMRTGLLLLQRFGPGGPLRLVSQEEKGAGTLRWIMDRPAELANRPLPPPPYLEDLFHRLARRIPAEAMVEHVDGVIPQAIGLRWG
ncbi:MAG: histidine kinase [Planctomycetota bacterium]|jgi:signal transduction histidine kinase